MVERSPSLIRSVSSRFASLRRSKRQPQPCEPAVEPDEFVTNPIRRNNTSSTGSSSRASSADSNHAPPAAPQENFGLGYSSIGYERHRVSSKRHSRTVFDPAELDPPPPRSSTPSIPQRKRSLMRFASVGRKDRPLSTAYECILDENEEESAKTSLLPVVEDAPLFVDLTVRPASRNDMTSSVRASALYSRPTSPPPRSPYTIVKPQHQPLAAPADVMQNVKAHMQAKRDLVALGPFYAVARGWKKGVYTSHDEALRQIRGFPGPAMLQFDDIKQALAYVESTNSPTASSSQTFSTPLAEHDEERLERTRIFNGLDAASAHRRSMLLSSERSEARLHLGLSSPAATLTA